MDKESISEIRKAVELAQHGDWMPVAVLGSALLLIILMGIYIWKTKNKQQDRDINNALTLAIATNRLANQNEGRINGLDKDLKRIENS